MFSCTYGEKSCTVRTINTKVFRLVKIDSKNDWFKGISVHGSHQWAEVRWQCFSSSETLHKKRFPVWVFMLYACRTDHHHQQPSPAAVLQDIQATHFWEVQGVCCWKRTIPLGAPLGCRDYTRSPYCCHCQSLHTAREPWSLQSTKYRLWMLTVVSWQSRSCTLTFLNKSGILLLK